MKKNNFIISMIIIVLVIVFLGVRHKSEKQDVAPTPSHITTSKQEKRLQHNENIDQLTQEKRVVDYLKQHHQLPDYYITKKQATALGWQASKGNLCTVLPGRAIGGDIFSNRQGLLPQEAGRTWQEADLNYQCGRRNASRVLYSNDGLIFVTHNHYQSFKQVN